MNVINLLNEYQAITDKMNILLDDYLQECDKVALIKSSSNIDGLPHGTVTAKKTEEDAIRLAEKFRPFKEKADEYAVLKKQIAEMIWSLTDDTMFKVIWYHYVERWTLKQVSNEISLSYRQTLRIRDKAIQELQARYGDD